ncbi:iron complex outermembrane receptor protein [Sinobacterium caligoides]|uniref:Iron complex outermembrane receptor protein n=1 Tax=Sinobacterium caligoides TaxID=933926 RepID=A0A3N2E0X6_9GAMM|nr:TonB-dependent receptor [Sinobacterium caligoides]ROS05758.1 iron complex outermembrane receptor protein [Sinobacterium caligoides]
MQFNPIFKPSLLAVAVALSSQANLSYAQDSEMLLEEVLVTAQKRSESSQQVPISMQAFGSEFLATTGVKDFSDLDQYTPGLTVNAGQVTQPNFVIRNIGTSAFGIGTDPAVGIYIDGVYSGRSGAALMQFTDIERVEILKGPQGTLFGRNSAAGAIQVVTKRPEEDFDAMARVRAGNYNKQLGEFMINTPVADTGVAIRLNGLVNKQDGYIDNENGHDLGNQDDKSFRFGAAWDVTEKTEIRYTYDYNKVDQDAQTKININQNSGVNSDAIFASLVDPDSTALAGYTAIDQAKADNPWDITVNHDVTENRESRKIGGHNLQVLHDLDFATLRYVASYRDFESQNKGDYDGTNNTSGYVDTENAEDNSQIYQELNLNGEFDDISWTVGASYYREKGEQDNYVGSYTDTTKGLISPILLAQATGIHGAPVTDLATAVNVFAGAAAAAEAGVAGLIAAGAPQEVIDLAIADAEAAAGGAAASSMIGYVPNGAYWTENIHNEAETVSTAIYGDITWQATEKLAITAGARATWDKKEFSWTNECNNIISPAFQDISAQAGQPISAAQGQQLACSLDVAYQADQAVPAAYKNGTLETDASWSDLSPRLVVDYQLLDNALVFASFTQGYKAGGFNSLEVGSQYDPEYVDSFEMGLKSQWFNNSLRYNTSLFHYSYTDKQDTTLVAAANGGTARYITETGDAEGTGLDTELVWAASSNLRFSFVHSYIHSEWVDRTQGTPGEPGFIDLEGQYLDGPKHQANVAVDYDIELGDAGRIALHLDHSYESAAKTNDASSTEKFNVDYDTLGDERHFTNARVAWYSPEENFEVALWGENIFGNEYVSGYSQFIGLFPTDTVTLDKPRYYGAEVVYRY